MPWCASYDPDGRQDQHAHHSQKLQAPLMCVQVKVRGFLDFLFVFVALTSHERPEILNHSVSCSWFARFACYQVHLGLDIWYMAGFGQSSDRTKTPSFPSSRMTICPVMLSDMCCLIAVMHIGICCHPPPPKTTPPRNRGSLPDLYTTLGLFRWCLILGLCDQIWV